MRSINLIGEFGPERDTSDMDGKVARELFNGPFRRLMEIHLEPGGVLKRHKALEPITVFCISGTGTFKAGPDLNDLQDLRAGTLITLDGGVEHEVVTDSGVHLLVTKFKSS